MLLNVTIQILQFMPKKQVLLEEKGLKSKGNKAPQNSILCNNPGHGELSFPVQPVLSGSWALLLCLAGDLWQGTGGCPQLPTGNLPRSSPWKPWEGSSLLPRRKYLPLLFFPFLFCFSLKQGLKERNRAFCQHCLCAFHMYTPRQENRKAFPKWHIDFRCALLNHPTHLWAPWKQAQQVQHRRLMACLYRTPGKKFSWLPTNIRKDNYRNYKIRHNDAREPGEQFKASHSELMVWILQS